MRILRIDSWEGETGGGAQAYVRTVSAELERRGHPQRIFSIAPSSGEGRGANEERHPSPTGRFARLGGDVVAAPAVELALARALQEFRPDLIHLHHFDAAFQSIARVLRRSPVPIVMTAHDAELVCPISTLVRPGNVLCDGGVRPRCLFTGCHVGFGGPYNLWQSAVFQRELAPHIRAYLAPTGALKVYLDRWGFRPALHLPPFAEVPAEVGRAPLPAPSAPDPVVGFLGRFERYKGVFDLLAAWPAVVRQHPRAQLDLAGDGPERNALLRETARLGVAESVRVTPWVSGPSKEAWFGKIDLLVFPSNMWENLGFVALEALARGRPVLGTRIGGIPDIVRPGVSGFLVPIADPVQLAETLSSALQDRAALRNLGLRGRAWALEQFAPRLHVERLESVYTAALGDGPMPAGWELPDA